MPPSPHPPNVDRSTDIVGLGACLALCAFALFGPQTTWVKALFVSVGILGMGHFALSLAGMSPVNLVGLRHQTRQASESKEEKAARSARLRRAGGVVGVIVWAAQGVVIAIVPVPWIPRLIIGALAIRGVVIYGRQALGSGPPDRTKSSFGPW
jgi:hypothetical protein